MNLGPIRKAAYAAGGSALTVFLGAFATSMSDGDVTGQEVVIAIGAGLAAAAAVGRTVWKVPNDEA